MLVEVVLLLLLASGCGVLGTMSAMVAKQLVDNSARWYVGLFALVLTIVALSGWLGALLAALRAIVEVVRC